MYKMEGMKQRQIAEQLGIPLRTVELRISEAVKFLRQYFEHYLLAIIFLLNF